MAQLIIRDLDDALLVRLKRQAWQQGLSLDESIRRLIVASVETKTPADDSLARTRMLRRKSSDARERSAEPVAVYS